MPGFIPYGEIYLRREKRRKIDKNVRSFVWQKYNGNSLIGKCYVCKRPITNDYFEIGHDKSVAKGGSDNIKNLRPICAPCNHAMGTMSIEQYRAKYFGGKPVKTTKKKPKRKPRDSNVSFGFGKIRIKPFS